MRQREMTRIPTPALSPLTLNGIDIPMKPAEPGPYTYVPTTSLPTVSWRDYWPDCSRCGQSMTGCYNGKANCNRCSSARRLNG